MFFFVSFLEKSLLKPSLTFFPNFLIPDSFSGIAGGGVYATIKSLFSLTSSGCCSFFLEENAFLPKADALPKKLLPTDFAS